MSTAIAPLAGKLRRKARTPLERTALHSSEPAARPAEAPAREPIPDLRHDPKLWHAREHVRAWAAKSRLHMWFIRQRVDEGVTEITVAMVEAWLLAWAEICGVPVYPPEEQEESAQEQLDRHVPVRDGDVPELVVDNRPREVCCECCGRHRKPGELRYCGRCEPTVRRQLAEQGWDEQRITAWCAGDDTASGMESD